MVSFFVCSMLLNCIFVKGSQRLLYYQRGARNSSWVQLIKKQTKTSWLFSCVERQFSQIIKLERLLKGFLLGFCSFKLLFSLLIQKNKIVFPILKHAWSCRLQFPLIASISLISLSSVQLTKLDFFYRGNEACSEYASGFLETHVWVVKKKNFGQLVNFMEARQD